LIGDTGKGITQIDYNLLNLPVKVTGQGGGILEFEYTFGGEKIRKNNEHEREYVGGLEYKNNVLELIHFPNGRIDKTGTVDTFQYYLTDHLGNIVVLFQDTDGDGAIALEEETNGAMDEVIQRNYYYSFGLRVDSPDFQIGDEPKNRYLYNGKELNEELDLNWLDYGFRWYDPATSRFTSIDRFAEKYAFQSPYTYAANNPIKFIDVNGDSVWTTLNQTYNDAGKLVNNFTIHVEGKVLNQMGWFGNGGKVASGINDFYNSLSSSQETEGAITNITFNVNFSEASSMNEVSESDHLIVLVDDVLGRADPALGGGNAGGLADQPGKIGYVEGSSVSTAIHEFGHMMGLGHAPNGTGNVMSYDSKRTKFTGTQIHDMLTNVPAANQGSNRATARYTTNNLLWHTSTNVQPWEFNVKKGDVIPRPLVNPRR
jgi:RHS repeat-associated protein